MLNFENVKSAEFYVNPRIVKDARVKETLEKYLRVREKLLLNNKIDNDKLEKIELMYLKDDFTFWSDLWASDINKLIRIYKDNCKIKTK